MLKNNRGYYLFSCQIPLQIVGDAEMTILGRENVFHSPQIVLGNHRSTTKVRIIDLF